MQVTHTDNDSLRSGQLARLTGVSTDTLRHYERKGLVKSSRSSNGYRQYSPHMVDRVRLIRNALAIGFGLDELVGILKIREAGGAPCKRARSMVASKLHELETLVTEMTQMRDVLKDLLGDWDQRLELSGQNQPLRLLESLSDVDLSRNPTYLRMKALSGKHNTTKEKP